MALELTDTQREQLISWERRRKSFRALALRSRIVLKRAEGHANNEVAAECGVSPATVGKRRRRFCELRLVGLSNDPRPGARRRSPPSSWRSVLVATLESLRRTRRTGPGPRWPIARGSLSRRSGGSGRAFGLAPHRTDTFKLSTDPLFVEKVYDVVGLRLNPPEGAVVYCVDEKI